MGVGKLGIDPCYEGKRTFFAVKRLIPMEKLKKIRYTSPRFKRERGKTQFIFQAQMGEAISFTYTMGRRMKLFCFCTANQIPPPSHIHTSGIK